MIRNLVILSALACLVACSDSAVDTVSETPVASSLPADFTAKPQGPVTIDYRIIGTPIVGQPLAIDIEVVSLVGDEPISLSYRINDSTAMELTEAQPADVAVIPNAGGGPSVQQVRLVPLREGRLFLNVSASVAVDGGTISSAIAIPVQVGSAPRQPEANGTVTTDDQGEAIHSLPASEN
jgi:hypothetical protein